MAMRSRRYGTRDAKCAEKAAEALESTIQYHAGPCVCRLCEAWRLVQVFHILPPSAVDGGRHEVLEESWED